MGRHQSRAAAVAAPPPGLRWVGETGGNGVLRERRPAVAFPRGRVLATPGAVSAFEAAATDPLYYLARHDNADWGELDAEDRAANDRALHTGERLLSAYRLPDGERL